MAAAALVTAAADAEVVRVRDFHKRYGRHVAVAGVDLAVARGQVYGLIGPDGAGKSSLLKAIAGVLAFDAGRVEVFGTPLDSERAAERVKGRLGFLPQGLGLNLYADLSVEENVDFFARLREVPEALLAARKERLLAVTRLAPFRDRPMKHLSGGMKQKLGLVCTLVHEPALIVLDEPTTGVDPVSRREFWTILLRLREERGVTVLVSTAYLDEATRFDRLAFLHAGRVIAEGEPEAIRARAGGRVVLVRAEPQLTARARLVAVVPQVEAHGAWLRAFVPGADARTATEIVARALGDVPATALHTEEPDLEDVFVRLAASAGPAPAVPAAAAPAARPAPTAPTIEALGLTRDFGRFRAVDAVSFAVRAGEIVALLGANGAGKTTVVKMLTGILPPTAGRGQVAGVDMRRPGREIKRRLGYVSQAFSLYHDLTVAENVRLFAGLYGLDGRETAARLAWVLEFGGLGGHEADRTGGLPVGLRQRLALGCALVHRPQALFLDEPTSGVDPIGRRRFWDLLLALARREGVAILLTTHHMAEAEHCDRVGLMFAGRLVADAAPDDLKREVEAEAGGVLDVATAAPARALEVLAAAGYAEPTLHGRSVRFLSRDPGGDAERARRLLEAAGVAVGAVEPRPLTMDDVFVARVTRLERAAAA
jgi:ABC-2 type transport system ATP-binding protein